MNDTLWLSFSRTRSALREVSLSRSLLRVHESISSWPWYSCCRSCCLANVPALSSLGASSQLPAVSFLPPQAALKSSNHIETSRLPDERRDWRKSQSKMNQASELESQEQMQELVNKVQSESHRSSI